LKSFALILKYCSFSVKWQIDVGLNLDRNSIISFLPEKEFKKWILDLFGYKVITETNHIKALIS
jgi:hypothetical protein